MSHHALLGWHQAVPVTLWRYTAERLHFIKMGFSMEQTVQGQLWCAMGFSTVLFLPRQVLLTHGIISINHRGKRRRGLLGRHDSAVEQQRQQQKKKLSYEDQYMKRNAASLSISWTTGSHVQVIVHESNWEWYAWASKCWVDWMLHLTVACNCSGLSSLQQEVGSLILCLIKVDGLV